RFGVRLRLQWGDDHHHVASVDSRGGLDGAEVRHIFSQAVEQFDAHLGSGLLTAAEHDHDLDLVAAFEEAGDMALLRLIIVFVDLETEANLLERGVRLVLPGFPGFLSRFVLVFSVVHELGYGWLRLWGYLDEIEPCLTGEIEGLANGNDTDLFTNGSDQPNLGNPNRVNDARLADVFTPCCSNVVLQTRKAPVQ